MFLSIFLLRKSVFVFLAFFVFWIGESILSTIEVFSKVRGTQEAERNEIMKMIFSSVIFFRWKVCQSYSQSDDAFKSGANLGRKI
jgi:hypothetical protein